MKLPTMEVIVIKSGHKCMINVTDFNQEKHQKVVAEAKEPEKQEVVAEPAKEAEPEPEPEPKHDEAADKERVLRKSRRQK